MSDFGNLYLTADGQTVYLGCNLCEGHDFADFVDPDLDAVLAAARAHIHDADRKDGDD